MVHKFSFIERILLSKDIIPHPFADATINAGLTRALTASAKLGLTGQLSSDFQSATQLARSCGIGKKGCALLLNCLEALGYVDRSGEDYKFSKRGLKHLDPQAPDTFHWFILFGDMLYRSLDNLETTIQKDEPEEFYSDAYGDAEWEIYSRAMAETARNNVSEISKKVRLPANATRLLDLGGSHGLYSIALCRRYSDLKAIVMDAEPVEKFTKEYASREKMEARVSFLKGDFLLDDLPEQQDVVLLFNIVHMFSEEENTKLLTRIAKVIPPGGQLIIFDQVQGVGSQSQLARAMTSFMALNLFHHTGGNTYSFEAIQKWALKAGFASASLTKLRVPGFGMVTCQR